MFVVLINHLFIDKVSLRVSPILATVCVCVCVCVCVLTQTCLSQVSRFEVLVHFFMIADRHSHQRLQTGRERATTVLEADTCHMIAIAIATGYSY